MFDAHCHLYDDGLIENIDEILENAKNAGVNYFLCATTDLDSMEKAKKLAIKYNNVFLGAGYYPCDVKYLENPEILAQYLGFIRSNKNLIKVIGEIGLDYYWEKDEKERVLQRKWFIYQIDLANENHLPICIHCRDAIGDLVKILKEHHPLFGFYLHAYNGSMETTKELYKLGAFFSVGGVLTYKNADNLREIVNYLPLERLFIETDAPYLPPVPHRGEKNLPQYIKITLEMLAKVKNMDEKTADEKLTENTVKFFHVEK
jgi:TatD DNase family protein